MSAQKLTVEVDPAGLEAVARLCKLATEKIIAAWDVERTQHDLTDSLEVVLQAHRAAIELLDDVHAAKERAA